ncbi:MAG: DEAD/DEAH box helicase family protein [Ruminococcus sp.]|nr:DEAD/DEAH box helicase family protein [Ruminococcus sp.]
MTNEESFLKLLDDMRNSSQSKREQGTKFEKLMQKVFRTSPLYAEMYDKVWLWSEFPYADTNDIGIDIVVKKRDKDEYTAIQCKFYDDKNPISKGDVDTFLSASGKAFYIGDKEYRYSERIIVSTNDKWSANAESTIIGQFPPVTRIRVQDLQECGINWDSFTLDNITTMQKAPKKMPRPHQIEAIQAVINGLQTASRGKLIMACGTGKTFTSLKIAENQTQGTGNVLFLVPSISLLNQTLLEWSAQCSYEYRVFAVCSDPKASKDTDSMDSLTDTLIPATTNVNTLMREYQSEKSKNILNLFFSTYQSISVIHEFQEQSGIEFDLTICDEAHRTTGIILSGDKKESEFVRVHDEKYIKTAKRLYMTATPRVYGDSSKKKADENSVVLCSMDDISLYGEEFYRLGFAQAVKLGLLSDYKVIVLAVDEEYAVRTCQKQITDKKSELTLDDSVKIIGCLNGLSKKTIFSGDESYFANDPLPMKTAVAFSSKIADSKQFVKLVQEVQSNLQMIPIHAELQHVDGKQNATERKHHIEWLKEPTTEGTCRILSNARCLSEGIDVPALDAVIFINPRKSMVDIIQSVGRVMRKAEGKQYGYIILPIGIPAGVAPEEALNKDTQKYKVVWEVLQALRSHDDRFNDTINKIDLNKNKPKQINIIGVGNGDNDSDSDVSGSETDSNGEQIAFALDFGKLSEWKDEIYAKIVKKCGSRQYWELWAKDIAEIATRHIQEINILLENPEIAKKFAVFLKALQMNLNSSIQQSDAVEMLAEHMITKPVFDALFESYEFVKHNPVSQMMEEMLAVLNEKALDKEQETLDKFYASVRERAKGIDNADGKQRIIIELYEQFFKNALPKQVQKLGIVYTPVEVVDFIIKSVDTVLKKCFNKSLNSRNVHILDAFTGTGTFIVRLLRSGLIDVDNLLYKYTNEIHANEIVLLAYYIATINIEETFHDLMKSKEYISFNGIVLTDTFAMTERQYSQATEGVDSFVSDMFVENSQRAEKQLSAPITVIIGNPPYSIGQKSENDNNKNTSYPQLDNRISETYVAKSKATSSKSLYDSYIKAFRWSTDRIGDNGIIGFVSNGTYLDSVAMDGFRQCLLEDFTHVYVFNLRGNQRTSGELSRKEGGKIFGSGSRTPVAITLLIKRSGVQNDGFIHYHDIGDYLTREEKLNIIAESGSIDGIEWEQITANQNNDWINQRNQEFVNFIALGDKKKKETITIFSDNYALGLGTNRDSWVYNFNAYTVIQNANNMIDFYNSERQRCHTALQYAIKNGTEIESKTKYLSDLMSTDTTKISWSSSLIPKFIGNTEIKKSDCIYTTMYRPFCKKNLAYNKPIIHRTSRWNEIFPEKETTNYVIGVSGSPLKKQFSIIITDTIQDLNLLEHSQCFPLYMYEKAEQDSQMTLFDTPEKDKPTYTRRDAITDEALQAFRKVYGEEVTKEDIFYYIYAVLQSKGYISAYQDNLSKEMPRIPFLKGFAEYVRIGKALADVHLNYEKPIEPSEIGLNIEIDKEDYTVKQMKFLKSGKNVLKDTIIFNENITISGIPDKVYEYIINGKSAVEWVMERYAITTDKASGITDNPNDYGDEKYIFNLLISVMSVSLKTLELIDSMPEYTEI